MVILEQDCTAQILMDQIQKLLEDKACYCQMQKALHRMVVPDSAERLCTIMEQLAAK